MSLKFAVELFAMTVKNDAKFKEELTCHFKIDMRFLANFDSSTRKSQKFSLYKVPFEQSVNCLS